MKIIWLLILGFSFSFSKHYVVVISKKCVDHKLINIQLVYLKKQRRLDSCHVTPLNLNAHSEIRKTFVHHVIGMSDTRWNRYWDEMHFKGVRAPHIVTSDKAMVSYIKDVPGAVGYIPESMLSKNMHVLMRFEVD